MPRTYTTPTTATVTVARVFPLGLVKMVVSHCWRCRSPHRRHVSAMPLEIRTTRTIQTRGALQVPGGLTLAVAAVETLAVVVAVMSAATVAAHWRWWYDHSRRCREEERTHLQIRPHRAHVRVRRARQPSVQDAAARLVTSSHNSTLRVAKAVEAQQTGSP